jgi:thiamine-monophosphate kinase
MTDGAPIVERELIRALRQRLAASLERAGHGVRVGLGDDCAVLEPTGGAVLVATTDLLIEDVHFRRRWAEPADIGWKALAVNLSDIAAMGARPRWALVALACPPGTAADEVEAFYEGALALADRHDVVIVGGDTSASPSGWFVNVTVLGEAVGAPLRRSGARPGDILAVTGALGRSGAGLALVERPAAPDDLPADVLADHTGAHLRPVPRVPEGRWLGGAGGVTAMIDLSDGLATDVAHVAAESGVGVRVEVARLPVDAGTRRVAAALGADALAWATGAGEDYELLLACAPAAFPRLRDGLARTVGTRLTVIGEVVPATAGVGFVDAAGRSVSVRQGFEHFATERPGA